METYWVTFRLATGPGYDARYASLMEALQNLQNGFWAEPTSFFLLTTGADIDYTAGYLCAGLDASKDLLVIRYLAKDGSRYFGNVELPDVLRSFMPNIKKL